MKQIVNNSISAGSFACFGQSVVMRVAVLVGIVATLFSVPSLFGQTVLQSGIHTISSVQEATLSGTFHLYYVSEYGDKISEVDSYRLAVGDGECLAFVLKTDTPVDVSPFLDRDELQALVDIEGTVMQSEFMLVPDQNLFETISWRDYAEQFAHKRVRVSGTLFFPMAGWHYITPVAVEFGRVEVLE